ncbi:MAG TPA: glycosyltransferase family 39 protein, partial [Terriglobales bacterium]|nr:glycosyltransferase family 39 protein [Terriglobales bacterium]
MAWRRQDALFGAGLLLLLLLLTAVSWHRWADIVVDAGLAMNQPLRLLRGERLYSDVYQLYGPLPPYICAGLYRIFGVSLSTLYATGFACAALALALYYWLARRILAPAPAAFVSALFLGLCEFKLSGNYIFPYTYAADFAFVLNLAGLACLAQFLHTRRRAWMLATGVAAGLALACKIEIGGALAVAAGVVLLCQSKRGRRRSWWADMAALVVPGLGIPLAAYAWALQYASWKQVVLDSYLLLYNLPEPLRFYNRWRAGLDHPFASLLDMALAVVVCGLIALLFWLAARPRRGQPLAVGIAACLALLAAGAVLHHHPWQSPLRASPLLVILLPLWLWKNARPLRPWHWLLLAFCVDGLLSMGRVILRVPSGGVAGSFVIPVVLLLWVWVMVNLLPARSPFPAATIQLVHVVLAVAALATLVGIGVRYRRMRVTPLATARGTIAVPPQQKQVFDAALAFISSHTQPGEPVLALPAGSALNFFTDRPDPLRWDVLIPGYLTPSDERDAIARLQATHTRYIFLMNRP